MSAWSLARVFVRTDLHLKSESLPVQLVSHFPGRIEVLDEWTIDGVPGGSHWRVELHDGVEVTCVSFVGSRARAVRCWPGVATIVPPSQQDVMVTLECRPDADLSRE